MNHIRTPYRLISDNREFVLFGLPLCAVAAYTSVWLYLNALFFLTPVHVPYFWLFDGRF